MAMPMRTRLPGWLAGGNLQARAHVRFVPIEIRGLARGQERTDRTARQLQDHLAGFRRGELHRQDAVLEFDREQFGGGVHDVLRGGEIGAVAAQAVRPERDAQRQPQRLPGAHRSRPESPASAC